MEDLGDRSPHSLSGDYFEGAGYPLEDGVTTFDSAAPVEVGMGVLKSLVTTTQGHFLDHTNQTESCLVSEVFLVYGSAPAYSASLDVCMSPLHTAPCESQLTRAAASISEALHLLSLWGRRQLRRAAHACNLETLPRDTFRPQCEFIHCQCESCAAFHTAGGDWQNSQCTQLVGCKYVQSRVCYDSSGHWCDSRENLKGCKGLSRRGIQSYIPVVMSAIMTTAQQLEVLPLCHTQVQLSTHQLAHERKRIHQALDRRWHRRQQSPVELDVSSEEASTQVRLSSQKIEHERRRIRAVLAWWEPSPNLATGTREVHQVSPAQHTSSVRKSMLVSDLTGPHVLSKFAAMVCTAVANGPGWSKARVFVDSVSEHLPLISQTMADRLGLDGPISGEATQADGALLPLRDLGNVDLLLNNKVVTQIFLSTPLSHYEVILEKPWLWDNNVMMDYAHNVLWTMLIRPRGSGYRFSVQDEGEGHHDVTGNCHWDAACYHDACRSSIRNSVH